LGRGYCVIIMNRSMKTQEALITLTSKLGKGGEATIYNIAKQDNLVAKIYHQPTSAREAKVRTMLLNPPEQPKNQVTIAWPTALLYQKRSKIVALTTPKQLRATSPEQFVGFLMPKITDNYSLFHIYNPIMRKQLPYRFDWQAMHQIAYNLCVMVQAIHAKEYVIGDINESNILVNRKALVTIVDCDSFQMMDVSGYVHRCPVGKPEFTPPELQNVSFKEVDQRPEHDLFGLGVLLFQLLMQGYHPFAGVLRTKMSVGRVDLYAIRQGLFPYSSKPAIDPPPSAPKFSLLHPQLQQLFKTCFEAGYTKPTIRPSAYSWRVALQVAQQQLTQCWSSHIYSRHLPRCPHCRNRFTFPPFRHSTPSKEVSKQKKLPLFHQVSNLLDHIWRPVGTKITNPEIKQALSQAHNAYQQNDGQAVMDIVTPLINKRISLSEIYEYRAWGHFKTRFYELALQDGKQAIKMGSTNPETRFIMGRSYVELGAQSNFYNQYDKAVNYFTEAINLNYNPLQEAHYYRAKGYVLLGQPENMIKAEWEKVLQLGKNSNWGKHAKHILDLQALRSSRVALIKYSGFIWMMMAFSAILFTSQPIVYASGPTVVLLLSCLLYFVTTTLFADFIKTIWCTWGVVMAFSAQLAHEPARYVVFSVFFILWFTLITVPVVALKIE